MSSVRFARININIRHRFPVTFDTIWSQSNAESVSLCVKSVIQKKVDFNVVGVCVAAAVVSITILLLSL